MLLPPKEDSHLRPIFSIKVPKQIGVHAVRRTKDGKSPQESAPLYSHWDGTNWGPLAGAAALARPRDPRGRMRSAPLFHCVRWDNAIAVAAEAVLGARGSRPSSTASVAKTLKAAEPPSTAAKPQYGLKVDNSVPQLACVQSFIVELLSDSAVCDVETLMDQVGTQLGANARALVDPALYALMAEGKVSGKSGTAGNANVFFFVCPQAEEEGQLPSTAEETIEATTRKVLSLDDAAQVSVETPQVRLEAPILKSAPMTGATAVDPRLVDRIIEHARMVLAQRAPLVFSRLSDELEEALPEICPGAELVASAMRVAILRGLVDLTEQYAGSELSFVLADGRSAIPPRGRVEIPVEPTALRHGLLEILSASDHLTTEDLVRRAANLFPCYRVTYSAIQLALEQARADGVVHYSGGRYFRQHSRSKPCFVYNPATVTITDGVEKVTLSLESAHELRAYLDQLPLAGATAISPESFV